MIVPSIPAVYITGETNSPDFPLWLPHQSVIAGQYDTFLLGFNIQTGTVLTSFELLGELIFSTLLGGSGDDFSYSISHFASSSSFGGLVISGKTTADFPQLNPIFNRSLDAEGFIAGISWDGILLFSRLMV